MSELSPEIDCNHDNAHCNKCPDCGSITCDYCEDYGFKNMQGLKIHVCKMHHKEATLSLSEESAINKDTFMHDMDANYHELL